MTKPSCCEYYAELYLECPTHPESVRSKRTRVAKIIEEYLTHTDTSDIVENADYHGRMIASILEPELSPKPRAMELSEVKPGELDGLPED